MSAILPKVSVIIPAFNCECPISEAVRSVAGQQYENLEIIIVDDHSSDGTAKVVSNLRREFSQIVSCKNSGKKGPSGARNTGLQRASGEFVAFLDADDVWLPGHLAAGTSFLRRYSDIDVVFYNFRMVDFQTKETLVDWFESKQFSKSIHSSALADGYRLIDDDLFDALLDESFMHLQSMIIRRDSCKAVFFNEDVMRSEDRDFAIRLFVEANAKCAFKNLVTGIYYRRGDSLTSKSLDNGIAICNDQIKIFSRYLRDYKLSKKLERKLKRRIYERHLLNSYQHRKVFDYSKALESLLRSMQWRLSSAQFTALLKLGVDAVRSIANSSGKSLQ